MALEALNKHMWKEKKKKRSEGESRNRKMLEKF